MAFKLAFLLLMDVPTRGGTLPERCYDTWFGGNNRSFAGDGYCQPESQQWGFNSEECEWDGGDCCTETCVDALWSCREDTGLDCRDPQYAPDVVQSYVQVPTISERANTAVSLSDCYGNEIIEGVVGITPAWATSQCNSRYPHCETEIDISFLYAAVTLTHKTTHYRMDGRFNGTSTADLADDPDVSFPQFNFRRYVDREFRRDDLKGFYETRVFIRGESFRGAEIDICLEIVWEFEGSEGVFCDSHDLCVERYGSYCRSDRVCSTRGFEVCHRYTNQVHNECPPETYYGPGVIYRRELEAGLVERYPPNYNIEES